MVDKKWADHQPIFMSSYFPYDFMALISLSLTH